MKSWSPLRYPGGKASMAGLIRRIRRLNGLGNRPIAEPFAGGAGASLGLLYLEETPHIYVNDADPGVYSFWWSVVYRAQQFQNMLSKTHVTMAEWRRQRDVYRTRGYTSRVRRGFAAFFLNRCNRSGIIINGGPIGGVKQSGTWKLDARFNKPDLLQRCARLAEFRDRIFVSSLDGLEFIETLSAADTFFFVDPPYYVKGQTLYLNTVGHEYHEALASRLRAMSSTPWVLTYDDCPEIRRLYREWAMLRPFTLQYTAYQRRRGNELLITPSWMQLPTTHTCQALTR